MPVENTTNISGLDATQPPGTALKSEGDDHLRLLKDVLKHAFAGFAGEVLLAATEAQGATTNDYALTVSPAPAAYAANTLVIFRSTHANTGAATLRVGALSVVPLINPEGTALRPNAITASTVCVAVFDGTSFRLLVGNSQTVYDYANQLAFSTALPAQTGNANKFMRTNGTTATWEPAMSVYPANAIPNTDVGPIFVPEFGPMYYDSISAGFYLSYGCARIDYFPTLVTPVGYIKANGATVSRTTYRGLFHMMGTSFGAGNGTTTFVAGPDMRGEFLRGFDDGRGVDAGRVIGSAQSDAIRNITGSVAAVYRAGAVAGNGALSMTSFGPTPAVSGTAGANPGDSASIVFNASNIVPTAAENRPRNVVLMPYIKI